MYQNRIINLELHDARDLTPHPGNWRNHGKAQVEALRGVLGEVGIAGAILAYRSPRNGGKLTVIDGHLRRDAAPQRWPVLVLDVDDAEADYILSTHDPLAAMATADAAALDALLSSVNSGEAAVQQMLADLASEAGLYAESDKPTGDTEPQVNRADELRQKWGVEPGQLWELGAHRLICGDCTDGAVVARLMGGEKADAVVTDPPYGQNQAGVTNDEPEKLAGIISGCVAILPCDNAIIVAFSSPRTFPVWLDAVRACGHKFERMLWMYKAAQETFPWRGWLLTSEAIVISSVGDGQWQDVHPYSHDCYYKSEVSGQLAPDSGWHGSVKPLDVVADLISRVSADEQIVYEPFSGSGTTLIACENLGRRCRAVEISPAYVAVALERWAAHTGRTPELVP